MRTSAWRRNDLECVKKDDEMSIAERDVVISNINIHIKSIFTRQTTLEDAMERIILCRLAEAKAS